MVLTSMAATLSRRLLSRSLRSTLKPSHLSMSFSTSLSSPEDLDSDSPSDPFSALDAEPDSVPDSPLPTSSSEPSNRQRMIYDRPLENGLDVGIYKAILVGQVGQNPLQKRLKNGRNVTLFSVGTGGIRNNRRPLDNEEPRDYANRCAVQWHRVCVYPDRLGYVVMKNAVPGSILYLEGNLESKIFTDPITGLVRRIREIAIRQNGRVVFLGKDGDSEQATPSELRRVGYY